MSTDFEAMVRQLALELRWLSFEQQDREIKRLPPATQAALLRCWQFMARDKQLPLDVLAAHGRLPAGVDPNIPTILALAGRGFGKTLMAVQWCLDKARSMPGSFGCFLAPTAADCLTVALEGPVGFLSQTPLNELDPINGVTRGQPIVLEFRNGTRIDIRSAENPERSRGPQYNFLAADELAAWSYPQETWDNAYISCRLGQHPQRLITTTPRPIKLIKQLIKDPKVYIIRGSTYENVNLSKEYIDNLSRQYEGTRQGRQELHADVLDEFEGAIWQYELIDTLRVKSAPEVMDKVVIGVDPSVSNNPESDDTGIVAVGRGRPTADAEKAHLYVLADMTVRGGDPAVWAPRAVNAYKQLNAAAIVAEKNQGGLMVQQSLLQVDPSVRVILVHASQSKEMRAQAPYMKYHLGIAHHVGTFPALEDEMCQWAPGHKLSPNRMDAMCHAMNNLIEGYTNWAIVQMEDFKAALRKAGKSMSDVAGAVVAKAQTQNPWPDLSVFGHVLPKRSADAPQHTEPQSAAPNPCPKCGKTMASTNFASTCSACNVIVRKPDNTERITTSMPSYRRYP